MDKHRQYNGKQVMKTEKEKKSNFSRHSYFQIVPIPTLRRDNAVNEPCWVGIPTLRRTILESSRFLLCAEDINYII